MRGRRETSAGLPTRCLMKPPTKFLVEPYRFLKPVSVNACRARALLDCTLSRRDRPLLAGKHLTATHCLYGLSHVCHLAFESGTQSRKKIMISSHINIWHSEIMKILIRGHLL